MSIPLNAMGRKAKLTKYKAYMNIWVIMRAKGNCLGSRISATTAKLQRR